MTRRPPTARDACLGATAVAEGDPLPPEDRVPPPRPLSLDALYRAQAPRLLRFFGRRTDRQDAGDLVHESFVRIASVSQRSGHGPEEPAAYLSQIAKNLLHNRARSAFYRSVAVGEAMQAPPPVADLTAHLEARDKLRRLEAALLKLSPKTRQIFLAHRLDGATYGEIAASLGLTVKGVEWHMSKAIRHIHRLLDKS